MGSPKITGANIVVRKSITITAGCPVLLSYYSLSSSEFRRGEKVIDLHINQATFNRTETSKSSWKNWLEDKSIGATIYVSRTTPFEILSFAPGVSYWVSKQVWTWSYEPYFQKLQKLGPVRLVDPFHQFSIFVTFWIGK